MTTRLILASLAASAFVAVPVASAVEGAPLPRRDGVVISWQPRSSTAIVVTGDQRAYAIHTLRRVAPGTRVRVDGIKWGTPTSGIKWSVAPSGIKWGIKVAANGSFQSKLTKVTGLARTASLRGTVVRRFGASGAVVSIRGGTFVIPLRGAVWLPGGKRTTAVASLGEFGASVTIRVNFDAKGRPFSNRVVETAPPATHPSAPVAGRVIAVDPVARTLTVAAGTAAFPVTLVITLPPAANLSLYPIGSEIAATVTSATAPDTSIAATALSLNRNFAAADSPVSTVAVVPPDPAHLAAIDAMQARWVAGREQNLIPNTGVFTSERNRLDRIEFLITVGDKATAVNELDQFLFKLANPPRDAIDLALRDELVVAATRLRSQLIA